LFNILFIFCSGSLTVVRSEFENFIKNHGGTVAKSVTNSVTHLVRLDCFDFHSSFLLYSSETGTKKCQDAEAKGIEIVNEDWVRNMTEGGVVETSSKKAKKSPSEPEEADDSDGNRLSGKCFAISGPLVTNLQFQPSLHCRHFVSFKSRV
jgi:BRCT domain type II-containing protein